jgi:hypothetical protein
MLRLPTYFSLRWDWKMQEQFVVLCYIIYIIINRRCIQAGLKLNGKHQLLAYSDVNLQR